MVQNTYIIQRPERGKEANIFGEVWKNPEVMSPHGQDPNYDKDDKAQNR